MSQKFFGPRRLCKKKSQYKAKVTAANFDAHKAQFVIDRQCIVELEEIPPHLIINWDHTGIHYVPVGNWTFAKEGSKRVEIAGADDKRQTTAVFAGTKSGKFLPLPDHICWQDEEMPPLC